MSSAGSDFTSGTDRLAVVKTQRRGASTCVNCVHAVNTDATKRACECGCALRRVLCRPRKQASGNEHAAARRKNAKQTNKQTNKRKKRKEKKRRKKHKGNKDGGIEVRVAHSVSSLFVHPLVPRRRSFISCFDHRLQSSHKSNGELTNCLTATTNAQRPTQRPQ